jgi:4'-phosphopantetheinyl transferase
MTGATDVYWLEQIESDMPAGDQWLSAAEKSRLASLRFEKRRAEWSLGRWTAKRAVASCLNLPFDVQSLQDIELRAASSGAPEVFLFNQRAAISVSLSHRARKALCVVGLSGTSLGCDLELVELRDDSFLTDFFTADEQQLVERAPADTRPLLTTLLWSAKESALKALHGGLRFSTTSLEVHPTATARWSAERSHPEDCSCWSSLSFRGMGGSLRGWWRCANNMVRTIAFDSWQ